MPFWWSPVDVTEWALHMPEVRGRRTKHWLQDPDGAFWLWKEPPHPPPDQPHTARRSEPAVEIFALELVRRLGIPVASARPAIRGGLRGIVSRRFHGPDEESSAGVELLRLPVESGDSPETKRRRAEGRASATLSVVGQLLRDLEQEKGGQLVEPFVRILVADAWLGNGDRHSGNWAVIYYARTCRLAPMYDPAACLGVELTDERPVLAAPTPALIRKYCDRCPSGFGGGAGGAAGIPMRDVLADVASWPEWAPALAELLPRIRSLSGDVPSLLAEIPDDWLSPERKRFAELVLAHRVTLLE